MTDVRSRCAAVRCRADVREPGPEPEGSAHGALTVLRASALEVTAATVPSVAKAVARVQDRLGIDDAIRAWVANEPNPNARVLRAAGAPVIVLSGALVTLLEPSELDFAIGHELGHHYLDHAATEPVDAPANRAAELSADRVGLLASPSLYVATRVMLKLASGLPSALLGPDVAAFATQTPTSPDAIARAWAVSETHPPLPFRAWALQQFAGTATYAAMVGQGAGGHDLAEVDARIDARLAVAMGADADDSSRLAGWLAAVRLLDVPLHIAAARLGRVFGGDRAPRLTRFREEHGDDAVRRKAAAAREELAMCPAYVRRRVDRLLAQIVAP